MRRFASLLVLLLCVGCGSHSSKPVSRRRPDPLPLSPWLLTCNDPQAPEPALLWNGLIGVRSGRLGGALGPDGKPLPLFAIDAYQTSGEEKILPQINPLPDGFQIGGRFPAPNEIREYRQELDMRTGVLTTQWSAEMDGVTAYVQVETVLHPTERRIAQRWRLRLSKAAPFSFDYGPRQADGTTRDRLSGSKIPLTYADAKTPGTAVAATTDKGDAVVRPFIVERVVSLGTPPPAPMSFEQIADAGKKIWDERWKTDVQIDGPTEDQQAIRSFLFYLRSSIGPGGHMALSPFGLSDAQYNGHVFWDADIWDFPALALVDPEAAKAIPDYRLARLAQAEANFKEWIAEGRPVANGKLGPASGAPAGAKYPWESSVTGRETVPGPSQFEDHITGSVAWGLQMAASLGLADPKKSEEALRLAAAFYAARSIEGPDGLEIRDTMSPDENHVGNNDLYTNLLAQWLMQSYSNQNKPVRFHLPHDATSFLTYDDDPLRGYKQAAAVLSVYPLQYPPAEAQAKKMMDRFADKVSKSGPAMTDSVHSIVWSRLGQSDLAYESWKNSWEPFTRHPFLLFSEKRSRDTTYFTTGASGTLQSVLYGFLGFRIDSRKEPGSAWSQALFGGRWLSIKPNLPPAWKSVKFTNFTVRGRRFNLLATPRSVTVTQGE